MKKFVKNTLTAFFVIVMSACLITTSQAALHDAKPWPVMFTKTAKAECNRVSYMIEIMGSGTMVGSVPLKISDVFQTGGQLFGDINIVGGVSSSITSSSGGFDVSLLASAGKVTKISYVVEFDTSQISANRKIKNQAAMTSSIFPDQKLLSDDPSVSGEENSTTVTLPPKGAPQCVKNSNSLISIQQLIKRVSKDGCGNLVYNVYLKGVSDVGSKEVISLKDLFPAGVVMTSGPRVVSSTGISSTAISHPPFQSWQADITIPSFSDSATGGNFLIELEYKVKLDPNKIPANGVIKNQVFLSALNGSLADASDDPETGEKGDATQIIVDVDKIKKCQGTSADNTPVPHSAPQCFALNPKFDCSDDGEVLVTLDTTNPSGFSADTMDVVCTTPGVTALPVGMSLPGGRQTLILAGAVPGQTVDLTSTGVQIGEGTAPGTDMCCTSSARVKIPQQVCKPKLRVTKDCDPAVKGEKGITAQCRITVIGTRLFAGTPVNVIENFTGGGTITNITPADPLDQWTCGATPNTSLSCTIDGGDLMASGGSSIINATITFPTLDRAKGSVNCAIGTYGSDEENSISTPKACDDFGGITVEKRFTEEECSAGGACNFTITLTNESKFSSFNGPIAVNESMTGLDLTIQSVSPQLCNPDPTKTPFACVANVSIPANSSQTYLFNAYFPLGAMDNDSKVIKNCATTAAPPFDTKGEWWTDHFDKVPSETSCSEAFACGFACHMNESDAENLTVVKEVKSDENCKPGGVCVYSITLQNNGTSALTSPITLKESVPAGASLVSVSPLPWSCAPSSTVDELSCAYPPGSLAAGATLSFNITLAIPAKFSGKEIKNCVSFLVNPQSVSQKNGKKALSIFRKNSKDPKFELLQYLAQKGYKKSSSGKISINGNKFSRRGAVVKRLAAPDEQSCVSTPVSQTTDPTDDTGAADLEIVKACGHIDDAGKILCEIKITSLNGFPPAGDLVVIEENLFNNNPNNAPVITSVSSSTPNWVCLPSNGNLPSPNQPVRCRLPASNYMAAGSLTTLSVELTMPSPDEDLNDWGNCATLHTEKNGAESLVGKSCVPLSDSANDPSSGNGTPRDVRNLSIVKTQVGECVAGSNVCDFNIQITNTGTVPMTIPAINEQTDAQAPNITTSSSNWACSGGGSTRYCFISPAMILQPGASENFPITVDLNDSAQGNFENCAMLDWNPSGFRFGGSVTDLQRALVHKGFNPGPVDGVMGKQTIDAIRDAERAAGLSITGEPSAELFQNLAGESGSGLSDDIGADDRSCVQFQLPTQKRTEPNVPVIIPPIHGRIKSSDEQHRRGKSQLEEFHKRRKSSQHDRKTTRVIHHRAKSSADDHDRTKSRLEEHDKRISRFHVKFKSVQHNRKTTGRVHNRNKSRLDEFHKRFESSQHNRKTTGRVHNRAKSRMDEFHKRFKSSQHDRKTTGRAHNRNKSRMDEFHKRFKSAQHNRKTTGRAHNRNKSRMDEFHKRFKSAQHNRKTTGRIHNRNKSRLDEFHKRFKSSQHNRKTTGRVHNRAKSRLVEFHKRFKSSQHNRKTTGRVHNRNKSRMIEFHKRFKSAEHNRKTTRRVIRHDRRKSFMQKFHKRFKSSQHDRKTTKVRKISRKVPERKVIKKSPKALQLKRKVLN